jgi:EpsI family protein
MNYSRNVNLRMWIVSGLMLAGTLYIPYVSKSDSVPIRQSLSMLPISIGGWKLANSIEFDKDTINSLRVNDYINRIYLRNDGVALNLYVGYYATQRQGATMHSPLNCMPGAGWIPITNNVIELPVQSHSIAVAGARNIDHTIRINQMVIEKGLDKQVVLYWYQSHGRVIASEYWARIYTVIDAIRLNRTDAAMVRVISAVKDGQKESEQQACRVAIGFVDNIYPFLYQYLPD